MERLAKTDIGEVRNIVKSSIIRSLHGVAFGLI